MNPQRLKCCGLTTAEAVQSCKHYKVGFAGFIAYPPSPRHLDISQYLELIPLLDSSSTRCVLVTVDAEDHFLDNYIKTHIPDYLQLHGKETPERCEQIKARYGLPIIKAFAVGKTEDLTIIPSYYHTIEYILLDTKKADGSSGGAGLAFDWTILKHFTPPLPWFLSGGLGLDNIIQAVRTTSADFFDVSSSLETQLGKKDIGKINDFMNLFNPL